MRRSLLAATLLAAPLAWSHGATAQPVSGLYVGLGAGGNILMDEKQHLAYGAHGPKLNFDLGEAGLGSVGWGFGNGFRVELEGNFRNNGLNKFTTPGFLNTTSGEQQSYGAMVNLLFDLDVRSRYIYPYVGVGAGWAHNHANGLSAAGSFAGGTQAVEIGGDNDNFAYQGIFGLSFPIPWVVGLSGTLEYRFYGEPNPGAFTETVTTTAAGGTPVVTRSKFDINRDLNHSVLIGLRYAFNVAPPPPPPAPGPVAAPVPAPSRSYLVFFDWDRADLTERARQVVAEAARNAARVRVTTIEVNGYTDTSGTRQYNRGLSVRRARAVEAELIRDGVAASEIGIRGFGETHLLVPTGNGVREPQNRRVEIILR